MLSRLVTYGAGILVSSGLVSICATDIGPDLGKVVAGSPELLVVAFRSSYELDPQVEELEGEAVALLGGRVDDGVGDDWEPVDDVAGDVDARVAVVVIKELKVPRIYIQPIKVNMVECLKYL